MSKRFFPKGYSLGKYAVGTSCFSIVDTGRKEVLGEGSGDRKIAVRMYYPVDRSDVAGREYASVFSEKKKEAIQKAYYIRHMSDEMNTAEYYEDVPFARDEKFPLIMFSMGYNSYVESNTYLLCALASAGYIIASVGHAYEAVENDYEDGTFDLYDKKINKKLYTSMIGALIGQGRLLRKKRSFPEALSEFEKFQNKYTPYIKGRVRDWKRDIEKAHEAVKSRYAENIDLSRGTGAAGHSLGGCLAYYLCRYNEEFSCGINMDGGLFGDYPKKIMEKPFCQISCAESVNVETRPFLDTNADTYQVIFEDMKHMGFTDAKFYLPGFLSGKLGSEELFNHLLYCHLAFFDKYLKGLDTDFKGLPSKKIHYRKVR